MKCSALLPLAILLCLQVSAQTIDRHFGKVGKEELLMKNCDFDKNAEALVLFDIGSSYGGFLDGSVNVSNEKHIRIKILNDKGLDKANIKLRYYNYYNLQRITDINAQTYNLDNSGNIIITKLDKKTIFDKRINKRYSEVTFTLPEVKVGSVIEYKYSANTFSNFSWYFQQNIPVLYSECTIDFPRSLEIQCMPLCSLPYQSKNDNKSDHDVHFFSMEKIPALNDESFISCDEDYLQRVETKVIAYNPIRYPRQSLTRSWQEIIKDLMDDPDFGAQIRKNIPRTQDLDLMLKPVKNDYQKMTIIHEYVRSNMKWNEYDGIWALEGVKSAWKDKKGTTGEINLILVNLLKDAGLNAHPLLISTRDHGRVNVFMPSTRSFNKVMAYVEIDSKAYVLDATEKYTPARLIPQDALACEGLVIEEYETFQWGWKTLWDDKETFQNTTIISAAVDSSGMMKGNVSITSYDHARLERAKKLSEGKEPFMKAFYASANPELKIDSLNFNNEKIDSLPLVQNLGFTEVLNSSGDYKYFNVNLFSGLEKNPFVADTRFSDVFFGYNQKISILGNIDIPANYTLEELPKNIRMMMPDTGIVFTRMSGVNENMVSFRIDVEFKKPIYGVDEYDAFKEFYKKMFNLLNEQFVIRKKS